MLNIYKSNYITNFILYSTKKSVEEAKGSIIKNIVKFKEYEKLTGYGIDLIVDLSIYEVIDLHNKCYEGIQYMTTLEKVLIEYENFLNQKVIFTDMSIKNHEIQLIEDDRTHVESILFFINKIFDKTCERLIK